MKDLFKRRGRVTVTRELLFDGNLDFIKTFFGNFYPVTAQWDDSYGFGRDVVYTGLSEHFDILEEGLMAPEYTAEVTKEMDGNYTIKFLK